MGYIFNSHTLNSSALQFFRTKRGPKDFSKVSKFQNFQWKNLREVCSENEIVSLLVEKMYSSSPTLSLIP